MSVAKQSSLFPALEAVYQVQASATLNNQIEEIERLHSPTFVAIPLDGSRRSASEWKDSVQKEMDEHEYRQVTYELVKITEDAGAVVAYATRRCAGVNHRGLAFNTEVGLRDSFEKSGNQFVMTLTETVTRKLWLNGSEIEVAKVPDMVAMVQGCSDEYNGPF